MKRSIWYMNVVVVARDNDTAIREMDRIERQAHEEKTAKEQAKWNTLNERRQQLLSKDGAGGNPSGHWVLHMPELDDENCWGEGDHIIDLPTYNLADDNVYARFQFVDIVGWLKIDFSKVKENWRGVELKCEWDGHEPAMESHGGPEYDLGIGNVAAITFTSTSECHGTINGWFGGPWKFKGVKVSLEANFTADNCKKNFESEKKMWDETRALFFGEDSEEKGSVDGTVKDIEGGSMDESVEI
jgi:hypothetical protein